MTARILNCHGSQLGHERWGHWKINEHLEALVGDVTVTERTESLLVVSSSTSSHVDSVTTPLAEQIIPPPNACLAQWSS